MKVVSTLALGALIAGVAPSAAYAVSSSDTADVVIQNIEESATADAYRVISVNWDDANNQPKQPQYSWAPEVQDWVRSHYPNYIKSDGSVSAAFETALSDSGGVTNGVPENKGAAEVYDKMSAAIKSGTITMAPVATTNTNSLDGLGLGSYLVLEHGGVDVYRSMVANITPKLGEDSLQHGVGHIDGASTIYGGQSRHSYLSAHRGLPGKTLFTDLNLVKEGDVFYIHVLSEIHAYEVVNYQVIKPEEFTDTRPEEGKDLVTLVTCTPYGINTERILATGSRVEYVPEGTNIYRQVFGLNGTYQIVTIGSFSAIVFLACFQLVRKNRHKQNS